MTQDDLETDPTDFCKFSDAEMKEFWCKHLRNDTSFLETLNLTHHHSHCIDVNSEIDECLNGNYSDSFVEQCHEDRYNLFMHTSKIPMCNRTHFLDMISIIVPIVFAVVIVFGAIGNGLVLFVVTFKQQMRNTTNVLILNLAIADLLFVVVCMPPTALSYVGDWPTGEIGCKFTQYLIPVLMYVSIYTLVLLSLDRYLAVVYPVKSIGIRTGRNTGLAILFVWALTLSSCTPILFLHETQEVPLTGISNRTICTFIGKNVGQNETLPITDVKEKYYHIIMLLTSLVIPLIAILALYANMLLRLWKGSAALSQGPGPSRDSRNSGKNQENKKRVTRMIIAVIIVFAVCWTPLQVILVLKAFAKYDDHQYESLVIIQIVANCLAHSNSCLNPLLYAFFSPNFRTAFVQALSRSSMRDFRGLNPRRPSNSQGRLLCSKDNVLETTGNPNDRRMSRPENNGPRDSLEMVHISSSTANSNEKRSTSNNTKDNKKKDSRSNEGMVHTEYVETNICDENNGLLQGIESINGSAAASSGKQIFLSPPTHIK